MFKELCSYKSNLNDNSIIRNSNIELLRILSMLVIVIGHFVSQTHSLDALNGFSLWFTLLIGSGQRIAVNVFIIISTWFMVFGQFKPQKLILIYSELWFYTFFIMLLMKLFHLHISTLNIIKSIFPFFELSLWFVSVYLILLAISPYLKRFFLLERTSLKFLILLLGITTVIMSTIGHFCDSWIDHLFWFIIIFLSIGYFKKYLSESFLFNKNLLFAISSLMYILLITVKYYCLSYSTKPMLLNYINYFLFDLKTLPNIIISLGIFYFFSKLNVGKINFINFMAKSCLAVYIIHQTPCFIDFLWNLFSVNYFIKFNYYSLYCIFVGIIIFITCIIIDEFRRRYIEPVWIKSKLFKFLNNKLKKVYMSVMEENIINE